MKTLRVLLLVVMLCIFENTLSARTAAATSYVPHTVIEEQQIDKRSAGIICLFHGDNPDAVRQLLDREFTLLRAPAEGATAEQTPVGKGRLTAVIGAHYLEAVIIDGAAKSGDVAQLAESFALVVLTNGHCETP